jgi:hypothetical protein
MRFYTTQHPFYCGIDLHARAMYVCIFGTLYDIEPITLARFICSYCCPHQTDGLFLRPDRCQAVWRQPAPDRERSYNYNPMTPYNRK